MLRADAHIASCLLCLPLIHPSGIKKEVDTSKFSERAFKGLLRRTLPNRDYINTAFDDYAQDHHLDDIVIYKRLTKGSTKGLTLHGTDIQGSMGILVREGQSKIATSKQGKTMELLHNSV